MPSYRYSPLSSKHDGIRLLRLMPHRDKNADIQCELFEYTLQSSCDTHLYEALSYVWGNTEIKLPIYISGSRFDVTINLHAALSQLRNHSIERVLWIDAVCIDQENQAEKEHQIQSMAKVYGQANRVVVWLGEAADDSDLVIEEIRSADIKNSTAVLDRDGLESAGLALLERPWFQRIWILQEVAAARNVLIMCGSKRIDGHAFCLGVDSISNSYKIRPDLQSLVRSVTYLIREAIFRPDYAAGNSDRPTLSICSLGGLIDMYHAHGATKRHDKVYALLGMCSDDLSKSGLSPNYGIPWEELLRRLLKHVISNEISVETWENKQAAVIKSRGCILGEVISVNMDPLRSDRQCVKVSFGDIAPEIEGMEKWGTLWTLQATTTTIHRRDIICFLQGASKPTIVRVCRDYFKIIVGTITFPEEMRRKDGPVKWPTSQLFATFPERNFLLVWDWEESSKNSREVEQYQVWTRKYDWGSEQSRLEMERPLARATRNWNVTLILGDVAALVDTMSASSQMEDSGREAVKDCETAIRHRDSCTLESRLAEPLPLMTARKDYDGIDAVVALLLTDVSLDPNLEDNHDEPKPLSWAAQGGHEAVVKLLLNSMHEPSGDVLLQAAGRGYGAVVRLLLEKGDFDVNMKDSDRSTPLLLAAEHGHEAVVRLLLETGKADVNSKDKYERTPLLLAAEYGHEAVVRLLLETGKADVNLRKYNGNTPLLLAAQHGYEAVVRLLLETGKADVDLEDDDGSTPLLLASKEGHEAVVRLLLETGKADVDLEDDYASTPLLLAAHQGHEAVVRLLLETGKVDVDTLLIERVRKRIDSLSSQRPEKSRVEAEWGIFNHEPEKSALEAILALLLEASKVKVNPENNSLTKHHRHRRRRRVVPLPQSRNM